MGEYVSTLVIFLLAVYAAGALVFMTLALVDEDLPKTKSNILVIALFSLLWFVYGPMYLLNKE